jgi:Mg2+ and Co2+ transporter CorA
VDENGADLASIVLQVFVGPDHLVVLRRGGAVNAVTDLRRRTGEWLAELGEAAPKAWVAVVALLFVHFDAYDRMLQGIEDAVESLNDRLFPAPDDTVLKDTHRVNQWITRSGRAPGAPAGGGVC